MLLDRRINPAHQSSLAMQHSERQMLLTGIVEIVDELYGGARSGDQDAALQQRLDPLLDAFLMESQPIIDADVTILLADIRGLRR